jgi:hypothetical protein
MVYNCWVYSKLHVAIGKQYKRVGIVSNLVSIFI